MGVRRASLCLAASVVLLCATGAGAQDHAVTTDGRQAIEFLNQQRHANGIRAIETVRQDYASNWCPNEDAGSWEQGEMARDWSPYESWAADTNPWDDAPLHQFSMYDPLITAAGDVNNGGACMGVGQPATMPSHPTFYSFVTDTGSAAVPASELVGGEDPFAPQQLVGIPADRPTGPQPILYALGFPGERLDYPADSVHVTSWSLSTGGVRVAGVRMVDEGTVAAHGYAGMLSVGAIMVPPVLAPGTTYVGHVRWRGPSGKSALQTFSFTTAGR
jgi:hypothetical protein